MNSSERSALNHPTLIVGVLSFVCLAVALLQSLVSPAISTIAAALHSSPESAAWAVTGFLLSLGIFTPIVGRLGDIHGKRRVFLFTVTITLVGTLLSALASTLWLFVLGRVIQGVAGGLFPLAFAIVRDELPRHRVAGALGLISALLGLGSGVGVVLAGIIVGHLSIHWLFWIPLAAIAIGFAAAALVIPESPVRAHAKISWGGAALMAAGLSAVLLGVSQSSSWGWGNARTIGLVVAGVVLLACWVLAESRSKSPLVDMGVMRLRGVWPVNLLAFALGFGLFAALLLVPQYAESAAGFGDSVTAGSLLVLPLSIVMVLVGPFAGRLEARIGGELPALGGALAVLAGFIVLFAAHHSRLPILIASGLLGLGIGMAFAAMANLIVQAVPPEETGVATGVNTVARTVGGAFGGQIAVTLVTGSAVHGIPAMSGFDHAFLLMVGASVLAAIAATAIPGIRKSNRPSEDSTPSRHHASAGVHELR